MTTKIRLKRFGAKKAPFYRMVVADSRSPRDGRFIEEIGYYDPAKNPATVKIDEEKALKWLSTGAQMTETAKALLRKQGILVKFAESKKGVNPETKTVAEAAETVIKEAVEEKPRAKRASKKAETDGAVAEEKPKAKRASAKAKEASEATAE